MIFDKSKILSFLLYGFRGAAVKQAGSSSLALKMRWCMHSTDIETIEGQKQTGELGCLVILRNSSQRIVSIRPSFQKLPKSIKGGWETMASKWRDWKYCSHVDGALESESRKNIMFLNRCIEDTELHENFNGSLLKRCKIPYQQKKKHLLFFSFQITQNYAMERPSGLVNKLVFCRINKLKQQPQ